jgi:hypothetical protein
MKPQIAALALPASTSSAKIGFPPNRCERARKIDRITFHRKPEVVDIRFR